VQTTREIFKLFSRTSEDSETLAEWVKKPGDSNIEAAFSINKETNGTARSDRARNKLPQRSARNMRRTLMHPRDPARSHGSRVSIVQQPGIGKSKCVWRPFLAPFSYLARSSRAFFLNGTGYFIQRHSARAPFDIAVSLHKIQGLHKTALRAPSTRARTPRKTAVTTVKRDARATDRIPKGISKCNLQRSASAH